MDRLDKTRSTSWPLGLGALAGLILLLISWAVPTTYAQETIETYRFGDRTAEIKWVDKKTIGSIKQTNKWPNAMQGEDQIEELNEFDKQGNLRKRSFNKKSYGLNKDKKYILLSETRNVWEFDTDGRLLLENSNIRTYDATKKVIKNETSVMTVTWVDGQPTAKRVVKDELTGKKSEAPISDPRKTKAFSASAQYEDLLKAHGEWKLKNPN